MELYDSSVERQSRLIKTVASAMGAEFPDEEDHQANHDKDFKPTDTASLPFGLGYATME